MNARQTVGTIETFIGPEHMQSVPEDDAEYARSVGMFIDRAEDAIKGLALARNISFEEALLIVVGTVIQRQ